MDNLKLFIALACVTFSSCVKEDKPYDQHYEVFYYKHADSFEALAQVFKVGQDLLPEENESLTFNGQFPVQIDNSGFYWRGKGKQDANFVFKQRKHSYANSFSAGTLGLCDFTCPDTVYMSQGFVIRLNNLHPENTPAITFNRDGPSWQIVAIQGDSAVVSGDFLSGLIGTGVASITLSEFAVGELQHPTIGMPGSWHYWALNTKKVMVLP